MWRIDVGGSAISAEYDPAATPDVVFVCAHGAGGTMSDRAMLAVTKALRDVGIGIVRFNFPYREKGAGRPDPMPRLEECFEAVVAHARAELAPRILIIGGRSLGGRAGSMLASRGFDADGLLLLAYPLHPPGQPHKLRDAHLPSIRMPVLCFNGTRDEFCDPALMRRAVARATADWTMHWLEGADHSFHVLKSSGRTDRDVLSEIASTTRAWLDRLGRRGAA